MGATRGYKIVPIPCPCGYGIRGYPYPWVKLPSLLYSMHHGLGRRLFGGGVGDLGGRCRARAGGRGMWDVEGGGVWGIGCGLPAWIGEAEQHKRGSPTRRRRCKQGVKVSTWK